METAILCQCRAALGIGENQGPPRGSGFRVLRLGLRVWSSGFRVWGFRV